MVENVLLRIGACALCILIGLAFWPAFLLAGLIGYALFEELGNPAQSSHEADLTTRKASILVNEEVLANAVLPDPFLPPADRIVPRRTIADRGILRNPDRPSGSSVARKREVKAAAMMADPQEDLGYLFDEAKQFAPLKAEVGQSEIRVLAEDLGIPHLIHFTRCDNLPSILRHGLCSIASCDVNGVEGIRNDELRLDGQPDGISLSITFPNYRMFYKYRQMDITADWAVLILAPQILWKKPCGFYRFNAADSRMRHQPREKMKSSQAFSEMFEVAGEPRQSWLRRYDPTDPQAEVLIYETIEPALIETVAFETATVAKRWSHALKGVDRIQAGPGKGLFGSRSNVRLN